MIGSVAVVRAEMVPAPNASVQHPVMTSMQHYRELIFQRRLPVRKAASASARHHHLPGFVGRPHPALALPPHVGANGGAPCRACHCRSHSPRCEGDAHSTVGCRHLLKIIPPMVRPLQVHHVHRDGCHSAWADIDGLLESVGSVCCRCCRRHCTFKILWPAGDDELIARNLRAGHQAQ